ncbi:unnamed protein product [Aureobasidium uvarum]|uniref:Uncharacterized protein n=1 Tax=Aureobasidium uvarum TaxID=2773716 RepID=A0A9N8KH89_9PEZI|nr:unnamed protein product [Aureobasidium uvarum]
MIEEEDEGPSLANRWANEHGDNDEKLPGLASRAWGLESHNKRKMLLRWLAKMDKARRARLTGSAAQDQEQRSPGGSGLTRFAGNIKPDDKVKERDEKELDEAEQEEKHL